MSIGDNVSFTLKGIKEIRKDDPYGGYRASIISDFDTMITPMQIDITTGDAITPCEVLYRYTMIFKGGEIDLWAYNVETILAEKVETILRRGKLNTRTRDFYDVYVLVKTQKFDNLTFNDALKSTATHRETSHIFNNIDKRVDEIEKSDDLM